MDSSQFSPERPKSETIGVDDFMLIAFRLQPPNESAGSDQPQKPKGPPESEALPSMKLHNPIDRFAHLFSQVLENGQLKPRRFFSDKIEMRQSLTRMESTLDLFGVQLSSKSFLEGAERARAGFLHNFSQYDLMAKLYAKLLKEYTEVTGNDEFLNELTDLQSQKKRYDETAKRIRQVYPMAGLLREISNQLYSTDRKI